MSRLNGSTNGNGKLFGPGGSLSPKKLFGEGGSISHPRQLLDAWGEPIRRDAPDYGFQVGHPIQFSSILSSGYRSYFHGQYDQAVKHSREGAVAMKNDCFLQALLNERKFAVASLNWHIEVDDERDKMEVAVRDTLTRILRQTPYFRRFLVYLLEAIWYGRYGSELVWEWAVDKFPSAKQQRLGNFDEMKYLRIKAHQPINGDKIGHAWDGTPYILVNPAFDKRIMNAEIHPTTAGADGLYLRGHWRKHFCIHTHEAVDMDYFDPMGADAIHGFGIRSTLFWLDWLRKEWLGNVADWCERTGLGIRLWYYQANNPASENAVKRAARESNDRTNIFIPRYGQGSGQGVEGVEYVDTSGSGAELLLKLQEHVEEHIERFIVGQSMSSGQDNESGLGGTGRSNFARDTKMQITAYDAAGLGETVTHDVVKVAQHSTFINNPAAQRVNARFVLNVDEPEPEKVMSAIRTFVVNLGGSVREDGVRAKLGKGFEKPQDGDEVISMETINMQKQAGMPQQPGMPGADPMAAMGGPPGVEAPPQAQAAPEPTDSPGSEDIQEKVNSQLDDIVSKMERMHGDIVRYHKEQQEGWVDLPESPEPVADKSEIELLDQYKKFFEEILV